MEQSIKSVKKSCPICCENINRSRHKEVYCPYCSQYACLDCQSNYFLNSIEPAHCMFKCQQSIDPTTNNHKTWNLQYLMKTFPRTFIWGQGTNAKAVRDNVKTGKKSYRQHREEVLLDQQMALMSSTQPELEKDMLIEKLFKERKELFAEQDRINNLHIVTEDDKTQYTNVRMKIRTITEKLKELEDKPVEVKIVNHGHCPGKNCPGFVGQGWKCGLCNTKICGQCREIISPEEQKNAKESAMMIKEHDWVSNKVHVCNEDTVQSIEHLKKSTYKSCPSCKVMIERSQGCNQMFCVNCKVFFDWKTGRLIKDTRFVHNPHYQEWLDRGGRRDADNTRREQERLGDCEVNTETISILPISPTEKRLFNDVIRFVNEIREYLANLNMPENSAQAKLDRELLSIRKRYLRGLYDKLQLSIHVQRAYKKESKNNETIQVREFFSETTVQLLAQMIIQMKALMRQDRVVWDLDQIEQISLNTRKQLYDVFNIAKKGMVEIGTRYHSTPPPVNHNNISVYGPQIPDMFLYPHRAHMFDQFK